MDDVYTVVPCINSAVIRPIAEAWDMEVKGDEFGFDISVDRFVADVNRLIMSPGSMVFLLYLGEKPIGLMGLEIFPSPLSGRFMASERYWYVVPEYRGRASLRLLKTAEKIARNAGCGHLCMTASQLASGLHDKTCKLYERLGMTHFETVYIKEL